MAQTSVTDIFTLLKLGRVHQCLDPAMDRVENNAYAGHAPQPTRKRAAAIPVLLEPYCAHTMT